MEAVLTTVSNDTDLDKLGDKKILSPSLSSPLSLSQAQPIVNNKSPFIEANTEEVALSQLENDCIIPVFTKCYETIVSHQEFINSALEQVHQVFKNERVEEPQIRGSHIIRGRTPDALNIPTKELKSHQKTMYYERLAFAIRIPSITSVIDGNEMVLTVGGVRALNQENLYNQKTYEKFKFFVGFKNLVCCNLCINTDGFRSEIKAISTSELGDKMKQVLSSYNAESHLKAMKNLVDYNLSEREFAQLIGKTRLYNYLPKEEKEKLPELLLNDSHLSTLAKDYYQDKSFCRGEDGSINLWKFYNLLTGSNKTSYVDTFLDRGVNAFEFSEGVSKALSDRNSAYAWFLS